MSDEGELRRLRVCHVGPETPGLSMTFVYREALALIDRAMDVYSVSIRQPDRRAKDVDPRLGDVYVLYDEKKFALIGAAAVAALKRPVAFGRSFTALTRDLVASVAEKTYQWRLIWHWIASFKLAAYAEQRSIDCFHAHFAHYPAQIVMYAALYADLPFSITAHANDIFERGYILETKSRRAAALVTISQFNIEALKSAGADPEKLKLVRCGVAIPDALAQTPGHGTRARSGSARLAG